MITKFKIGKIKFTIVFKHKWDNKSSYNPEFREYNVGLWFKNVKIVGRNNFNNPKEWNSNLVNDYVIGINLIICKAWISFNKNGMSL